NIPLELGPGFYGKFPFLQSTGLSVVNSLLDKIVLSSTKLGTVFISSFAISALAGEKNALTACEL
ncbi:MAG: hypothetical protein NZ602_14980, partial [Thermoguttaceae bacterium]|nr:hypothetical protein [Thermoguttaceae bacterium]